LLPKVFFYHKVIGFMLFDDKREVGLIWNGKASEVTNIFLSLYGERTDGQTAKNTTANGR